MENLETMVPEQLARVRVAAEELLAATFAGIPEEDPIDPELADALDGVGVLSDRAAELLRTAGRWCGWLVEVHVEDGSLAEECGALADESGLCPLHRGWHAHLEQVDPHGAGREVPW